VAAHDSTSCAAGAQQGRRARYLADAIKDSVHVLNCELGMLSNKQPQRPGLRCFITSRAFAAAQWQQNQRQCTSVMAHAAGPQGQVPCLEWCGCIALRGSRLGAASSCRLPTCIFSCPTVQVYHSAGFLLLLSVYFSG
jgi:hypothetical protein